jgi:hypothetical protein
MKEATQEHLQVPRGATMLRVMDPIRPSLAIIFPDKWKRFEAAIEQSAMLPGNTVR